MTPALATGKKIEGADEMLKYPLADADKFETVSETRAPERNRRLSSFLYADWIPPVDCSSSRNLGLTRGDVADAQ